MGSAICPNFWVWRAGHHLRSPQSLPSRVSLGPDTPLLLFPFPPICCLYIVPSPIAGPYSALLPPYIFFPKRQLRDGATDFREEHTPAEKLRGRKVSVPISAREGPRPNDQVWRGKEHVLCFSLPKRLVEDSLSAPRGYCRAQGGASGEGKASLSSKTTFTECFKKKKSFGEVLSSPPHNPERWFSGVLVISSAPGGPLSPDVPVI